VRPNGRRPDERIPDQLNPLKATEPEAIFKKAGARRRGAARRAVDKATRGRASREGSPASPEGKPLKGEPHERYRREKKPDRLREEQGVKRPRKPEGAA
jgi:hypothetical protein